MMPQETDVKCPLCGANPGDRCYGGGTLPRNHHPSRLLKAYEEEIRRLRNQLPEAKAGVS